MINFNKRKRRHSTGFGYIGFGNNQATFNQNASKPFSKYKNKLDLEAHLHYKMEFLHKDLTQDEKDFIKNKIRAEIRKSNIKASILSVFIFAGVAYLAFYLITSILNH